MSRVAVRISCRATGTPTGLASFKASIIIWFSKA